MLTTQRATLHTMSTGLSGTHDAATRLCAAWQWLETQRRNAAEGADVWDIRWQAQKSATYLTDLLHTLRGGEYRLSPLQLHGQGNDRKAVWGARDALVLKWVALSIEGLLPLHPSCEHIKGHGGGQQSIHKLHALLTGRPEAPKAAETHDTPAPKKTADYAWVCRTDIRGYYRHINKATLLNQVRRHVQDPVLVALINQYIHYTVEDGGTFHTPEKGISCGCPLSPLMGALHLYDMDEHFSHQKHIHYARYMDDVIILAKSRWSLRKHTRRLMQWFSEYGFEAHPDKTQIGRTVKGFDWMGAWLTGEGVTDIAPRAKANHREKVRRLYERLARLPAWLRHRRQKQVHARVSAYRKRWKIWTLTILIMNAGDYTYAATANSADAGTATISGFPTTLNPDATVGTNLGSGTINMAAPSARLTWAENNSPRYAALSQSGAINMATSMGLLLKPWRYCDIGFQIASVNIGVNVVSSGWEGGQGNIPLATYSLYNSTVSGQFSPAPKAPSWKWENGIQTQISAITLSGKWVTIKAPNDPGFQCSYQPGAGAWQDTVVVGFSTGLKDITYDNKPVSLISLLGANIVSTATFPTLNPPIITQQCYLNSTSTTVAFGDGKGDATGQIAATDLNARKNVQIAAITPSPLTVTATCVGGTGTPNIHGHITWANPRKPKWSAGFNGGLPADGDTSAPALLATKPVAYGDPYKDLSSFFDAMPTGLQSGDDFLLTPNVPKNLYPALLRDTSGGNVTSGTHTISATIKVVVD